MEMIDKIPLQKIIKFEIEFKGLNSIWEWNSDKFKEYLEKMSRKTKDKDEDYIDPLRTMTISQDEYNEWIKLSLIHDQEPMLLL